MGRAQRLQLDEVYVRINGVQHYPSGGRSIMALTFIKKALKRHGAPKAISTNGLRSYGAAIKEIGNVEKREGARWADNRAENSHQPFRRRKRAMACFRRMHALPKFSAVQASFHNHFASERHLTDREQFKVNRSAALAEWRTLAA